MNGDLANLSNLVGPMRPNTAADEAAALVAVMRAAHDAEDAARLQAMLGLGESA